MPLGATVLPDGVNFALFSRHAQQVELVVEIIDDAGNVEENFLFSLLPEYNRTGDIWHILLPLYWRTIRYGYRIWGQSDIKNSGLVFNDNNILIDPYCKMLTPRRWGEKDFYGKSPCCQIPDHNFNWLGDIPLKTPLSDTIIYEMHVRGFTQNSNSGVSQPGTYKGLIEKIPYLQNLGITAVELMPIAEFNENDTEFFNPQTGKRHKNFWGYNSINFFSIKSGYSSVPERAANEFKEMVLAFHQAGIEVYLDIVFNHTGEGSYDGTTTSFRGIDNSIYYLLDPKDMEYLNFSGCGNTMNCNHPVVRELIRNTLRYYVIEMHIDGFRFDLASILGRDTDGNVLANPPMLELIAEDPILRDTKIIAEAWDAGGLYQVGSFSTDNRWSEWNGKFRDDVRNFFCGNRGVKELATRIAGSSDLYRNGSKGPANSINFITSHDGFTLQDLVSYEKKRNLLNGEENRDGDNHNISWNTGIEGDSSDENIKSMRITRVKSMLLILLLSQGVPMITAGDEMGRTQEGNNNCWCQDNNTSWVNWDLLEENGDLFRFVQKAIALRKNHIVFRRGTFFDDTTDNSALDIKWQSLTPTKTDWSENCSHLGFLLNGLNFNDDHFFIMINGSRKNEVHFTLPAPPESARKNKWYKRADTNSKSPEDFISLKHATPYEAGIRYSVAPMSVVLLQSPS